MFRSRPLHNAWLSLLLASGLWSCKAAPSAPLAEQPVVHTVERIDPLAIAPPSALPAAAATPTPYPPGHWRSAREELGHTVLWFSHILIRHNEVDEPQVSFTLTDWRSTREDATRTRREALLLAEQLAERARSENNFADLARQFSEEPETAVRGGSVGGVVAQHLSSWPRVLDALASLKAGEVSRPVSTEYGYHVLYRRAPVPKASFSGRHIVIAHADAPWLETAARGELPRRSQEDALRLATRLFEQARDKPADFEELVEKHSEHRDAARGGDFGTWSTHEPSGYPRELETLAQLEVGEVAAPIDTLFGIQVIQRTPDRPRQHYAMAQLQVRFDPARPDGHPQSKRAALEQAQTLAQMLRQEPHRFRELQEKWCCVDILELIEGRNIPALETAMARLAPGQIAEHPVEDVAVQYIIPKRLELSALPPKPEPRLELPRAVPDPAR